MGTLAFRLWIITVGFLSWGVGLAQVDSLAEIDLLVEQIDNDSTLQVEVYSGDEFELQTACNGTEITVFKQDSQIVKFVISVGLSYGFQDVEIYFDEGENPKKIIEKESWFLVPDRGTEDKFETVLQLRYTKQIYMNNSEPIHIIEDGQRMFELDAASENQSYLDALALSMKFSSK